MPTFPVQYFTVGTVQEYVMPKGPEGTQDPTIVYWERAVRAEETWTEGQRRSTARGARRRTSSREAAWTCGWYATRTAGSGSPTWASRSARATGCSTSPPRSPWRRSAS